MHAKDERCTAVVPHYLLFTKPECVSFEGSLSAVRRSVAYDTSCPVPDAWCLLQCVQHDSRSRAVEALERFAQLCQPARESPLVVNRRINVVAEGLMESVGSLKEVPQLLRVAILGGRV